MRLVVLGLALALVGCSQSAQVVSEDLEGQTFTTFSRGDLHLTYVEVDDSTTVVFRSTSAGGGGFPGFDSACLTCTISKISECAKKECPETKDCSDKIRECARKKCEDEGKCKTTSVSPSLGVLIQ